MRSLRQRVGERLLASGAEMAFDGQHIARSARAAGSYDEVTVAQALALIRLLSRIKVRLGLLIMP
jgi:uncharacterized membrane protein YjjP (DUF1212 family)